MRHFRCPALSLVPLVRIVTFNTPITDVQLLELAQKEYEKNDSSMQNELNSPGWRSSSRIGLSRRYDRAFERFAADSVFDPIATWIAANGPILVHKLGAAMAQD